MALYSTFVKTDKKSKDCLNTNALNDWESAQNLYQNIQNQYKQEMIFYKHENYIL